jgi:hypothetical protein
MRKVQNMGATLGMELRAACAIISGVARETSAVYFLSSKP